jgi:hypothetical protein
MSELSPDDSRALVAEARLAPSVHNIQPTRWRISGVTVDLLGDLARAVPVADPVGRDWWCRMVPLSKGSTSHSAAEGLACTNMSIEPPGPLSNAEGLMPIARFVISSDGDVRPSCLWKRARAFNADNCNS